jgi:hypothetical protein
MIDINFYKWITASIYKSFSDTLNGKEITLILLGQELPANFNRQTDNYFELSTGNTRVTGVTASQHTLELTVTLLCSIHTDPTDIYILQKAKGLLASCFQKSICCYRYGDDSQDDGSYLGNLQAILGNQELNSDEFVVLPSLKLGFALLYRDYKLTF